MSQFTAAEEGFVRTTQQGRDFLETILLARDNDKTQIRRQASAKLARRFRAPLLLRSTIDVQNDLLLRRLRAAGDQDQLVVTDAEESRQLSCPRIVPVGAHAVVLHGTGDVDSARRDAKCLEVSGVFVGLGSDHIEPAKEPAD